MKEKKKYIKAGSFYLFSNLILSGIAFSTIPIYTRVLSAFEYGIVNTYTSWVAIVTIILGMAFHMSIRSAFSDYYERINEYVSSITVFSIIFAINISLIILIFLYLFPINLNFTLLILCLIQGFFAAIIQNYSMYLMMNLNYKWRSLLLVLPNIFIHIAAILAILFLFESELYLGRIIPGAFFTSIFGLIIIFLVFKKNKITLKLSYTKYALIISTPMIFHALSLNILSQSDRIMITLLSDASQTGIYSLVYSFSMIANIVIISLEGVWVPWFIDKMKNGNVMAINSKVEIYVSIITYMIIAIMLISPEVLKLLAPKEYWSGIGIIPPIVITSFVIFIYTLYVNIEHFHKKTKIIALNTAIAAILNITLNYIFIPKFGFYAAAYTTLVSYTCAFFLHYKFSKRIAPLLIPLSIMLKPFFLIIIVTLIYYFFVDQLMIRLFFLTLIVIYFFLKRKTIIKFVRTKK